MRAEVNWRSSAGAAVGERLSSGIARRRSPVGPWRCCRARRDDTRRRDSARRRTCQTAGMSHARPVMLITGGSRGIGAATAVMAAERGYDVAITYVSNEPAASDVVARMSCRRRPGVVGPVRRVERIRRDRGIRTVGGRAGSAAGVRQQRRHPASGSQIGRDRVGAIAGGRRRQLRRGVRSPHVRRYATCRPVMVARAERS